MKKVLIPTLMLLLSALNGYAAEELTRYYFYHNGDLPTADATCVDYRLDANSDISIAYSGFYPDWNNWQYVPTMNRDNSKTSLWLNSQNNEYWGASFKSAEGISLKGIEENGTLHVRLQTNCPRTIKFSLNKGDEEVAFFDFTIANTTYANVRDGQTWNDIAIPLSAFSGIDKADFDDAFTGTFFAIAGTGQSTENNETIFLNFEDIYIEGMIDLTVLPKEPLSFADARTLTENSAFTTLNLTAPTATLTLADNIVVTADELIVNVDEEGNAPQIILGNGAKIVANSYIIHRNVKAGQWNLIASPATFTAGDVTAEGTTLTKKRHSSVSHIEYTGDGNSIWMDATETDIIYSSCDRERNQTESYAIAVKADDDATVVIRGQKTTLTGKDHQITNVWQDGEPNTHNFNLVAQPYTSDYSGIFRSDDAEESDPDAANGVITYVYNPATDLYQANLLIDETPVYKPYAPFFSQSFANLSAPREAVKGEPTAVPRFSITLGNDEVTFIEQEGSTDGFDQNIDAVKLYGFNNTTPAIYAIDGDEIRTAVTAVPAFKGATFKLGVKVPEAGTYTLTAHLEEGYSLIIHESNKSEATTLHDGDTYDFTSTYGGELNYRLSAEYVADAETDDDTTNGINAVSTNGNSTPDSIYDLQGRKLTRQQAQPNNTYIIGGKKAILR